MINFIDLLFIIYLLLFIYYLLSAINYEMLQSLRLAVWLILSAALSGRDVPTICLIPLIPNGYIVSAEDNALQTIGDSSEEYNPVKVVCNQSYSLFHERANQTENQCQNEVWINEKWAECHRE